MTKRSAAQFLILTFCALSLAPLSAASAQHIPSNAEKQQWHDGKVRELEQGFRDAYEAEDWTRAIALGYQLTKHDKQEGRSAYNLACAMARAGRDDDAVKWLRNAATHGYARPQAMREDPDLESLREHDGYREVMIAVRNNHVHNLEQFKAWWDTQPLRVQRPEAPLDGPAPLIIVLHGFGSDAEDMIEVWRKAASDAGAVLAAPISGRLVAERGGFQWSSDDEAEWIIRRSIERVGSEIEIDPGRVVLTGFSQGAFVALRHALEYPEVFAGVIPVAGLYDEKRTPFNQFKDGALPRFFLMIGSEDQQVGSMRRAKAALTSRGAPVELAIYEGLGHAFPDNADEELARALEFVFATKADEVE